MKILLIHSQDVEVVKNKEATSKPQDFIEDFIFIAQINYQCRVEKI